MQVVEELSRLMPGQGTLLTIGVFDGVHLGHQYLIEKLRRKAIERGLLSGVITFQRHPQEVLAPKKKLTYLTSLEERISLIRALGIEFIITLSFTPDLSQLSAREFIVLLQQYLKMKGLVIGPDFALGRGREGHAATLSSLGQALHFTVDVVPPLAREGRLVSSTSIREALAQGDMRTAAKLLGRRFSLSGPIVPGDKRGRVLGFPTANLRIDADQALPPDGAYITWAFLNNQAHQAVTNVGLRPTFGSSERTVEVYLLNFEGNLYGNQLAIELVEKLRPEMRFASATELAAQIKKDVEQAKAVLEQEGRL